MDTKRALRDIKFIDKKFKKLQVEWLLEHYGEAKPALLHYVEEAPNSKSPDYSGHVYAMYIAAQMRDNAFFAPLLQYLYLDENTLDFILGDFLSEGFSNILASVMEEKDLPALRAAYMDDTLYLYARGTALDALKVRHCEGDTVREELLETFRQVINIKNPSDDTCDIMALTVISASAIGASELYDDAKRMYAQHEERFDDYTLRPVDIEELKKPQTELAMDMQQRWDHYIRDAVAELGEWDCFRDRPPQKHKYKIGRNDLCPCTSGKKYKKCCLNKENLETAQMGEAGGQPKEE